MQGKSVTATKSLSSRAKRSSSHPPLSEHHRARACVGFGCSSVSARASSSASPHGVSSCAASPYGGSDGLSCGPSHASGLYEHTAASAARTHASGSATRIRDTFGIKCETVSETHCWQVLDPGKRGRERGVKRDPRQDSRRRAQEHVAVLAAIAAAAGTAARAEYARRACVASDRRGAQVLGAIVHVCGSGDAAAGYEGARDRDEGSS